MQDLFKFFYSRAKYLNNCVPRLSVFYQPKDGAYSSFSNLRLVPRVLQALKCGAWGAEGHHNIKEGAVISRLQAVMASQLSS